MKKPFRTQRRGSVHFKDEKITFPNNLALWTVSRCFLWVFSACKTEICETEFPMNSGTLTLTLFNGPNLYYERVDSVLRTQTTSPGSLCWAWDRNPNEWGHWWRETFGFDSSFVSLHSAFSLHFRPFCLTNIRIPTSRTWSDYFCSYVRFTIVGLKNKLKSMTIYCQAPIYRGNTIQSDVTTEL